MICQSFYICAHLNIKESLQPSELFTLEKTIPCLKSSLPLFLCLSQPFLLGQKLILLLV